MDNQYNYYNQDGMNPGNYQYSGSSGNQNGYQSGTDPEHQFSGNKKKQHKKMPKAVAVTGLALLFGIVSSATFLTSNIIGSRILGLDETSSSSGSGTSRNVGNNTTLSTSSSAVTSDVSDIVESVMPSIVSITNMSVEQVQNFFGQVYEQQSEGAGTGIIIGQTDTELLIVTNNHVVENSDTLTVTFNDEASVEANIKGTDSSYDVAVIAVSLDDISDETLNAISIATLGDSTTLKVGEPAIAIGNALGYGQSVTTGVISAVNRTASGVDGETGEALNSDARLIQTDAAINPGNSGGALVNINGEVIGINSSKLVGESVEGVGYAIPISDISSLIENLMNQETKTRVAEEDQGAIGIEGISVSDAFSQQIDIPAGVYVSNVIPGGGAERAGMTKGCIITGINGTTVTSMDALQEQLQYYAVGDTVTLTIEIPQTNGEYSEQTLDVTLGEKQN